MKQMLISKFKARCIAEIRKVHRTGKALIITLRGEPIAQVVPLFPKGEPVVTLGSRRGRAVIKRDLAKIDFAKEWEMNR
jgi:antitoxin (DNA-binding transcriptional repressor) of toxin-antitoxin stability system